MTTQVQIKEWECIRPDKDGVLAGRFLDDAKTTKELVATLNDSGLLGITELRSGLEIRAYSHVGRIRIGDIAVTIEPKLQKSSLLRLLRYAYGFRRLRLFSDTEQAIEKYGFEDLLISQLNSEAQELISRGLRRAYLPQEERLSTPRGRIDIQRLALDGGTITATLPCRHHPYVEDTLVNQVLLEGLRLAGTLASVLELQRESRRLASLLEEQVSRIKLDLSVLERVERRLNRLTEAYTPSISLIRLLVESKGVSLDGATTILPGFLFDMNSFFQALISRLLRDNLHGYTVKDEFSLTKMMKYNDAFNPQNRRAPKPRPDFVVQQKGKTCSVLDAKYRDLWETKLPREMLYQLVVYAMSQGHLLRASIVFPTVTPNATESRIDVVEPIHGERIGQVCLRPVNLDKLEQILFDATADGRLRRLEFAKELAFGLDKEP